MTKKKTLAERFPDTYQNMIDWGNFGIAAMMKRMVRASQVDAALGYKNACAGWCRGASVPNRGAEQKARLFVNEKWGISYDPAGQDHYVAEQPPATIATPAENKVIFGPQGQVVPVQHVIDTFFPDSPTAKDMIPLVSGVMLDGDYGPELHLENGLKFLAPRPVTITVHTDAVNKQSILDALDDLFCEVEVEE